MESYSLSFSGLASLVQHSEHDPSTLLHRTVVLIFNCCVISHHTHTHTETHTHRDTHTQTHRDTHTKRHTYTDTDTHRDTDIRTHTRGHRDTDTYTHLRVACSVPGHGDTHTHTHIYYTQGQCTSNFLGEMPGLGGGLPLCI